MPTLNEIPIRIENPGFLATAVPLLHEIRHALQALAAGGEEHVIDLMAIPFGPGDEDLLLQVLGRGEVEAEVKVMGPSRIWESAFPGVWLLDHRDQDDQRVAFQVQVTRMPEMLRTPVEDTAESAIRLEERLREVEAAGAE